MTPPTQTPIPRRSSVQQPPTTPERVPGRVPRAERRVAVEVLGKLGTLRLVPGDVERAMLDPPGWVAALLADRPELEGQPATLHLPVSVLEQLDVPGPNRVQLWEPRTWHYSLVRFTYTGGTTTTAAVPSWVAQMTSGRGWKGWYAYDRLRKAGLAWRTTPTTSHTEEKP